MGSPLVDAWEQEQKKKNKEKKTTTQGINSSTNPLVLDWENKRMSQSINQLNSGMQSLQKQTAARKSYWDGNDQNIRSQAESMNRLMRHIEADTKRYNMNDAYDAAAMEQYKKYNAAVLSSLDADAQRYGQFKTQDEYNNYAKAYAEQQKKQSDKEKNDPLNPYRQMTTEQLQQNLAALEAGRAEDAERKFNPNNRNQVAQLTNWVKESATQNPAEKRKGQGITLPAQNQEIQNIKAVLHEREQEERINQVNNMPPEAVKELDKIADAWDTIDTSSVREDSGGGVQKNAAQQIEWSKNTLKRMGYDNWEELADARRRQRNAERAEQERLAVQKTTQAHPWTENAYSVIEQGARGVSGIVDLATVATGGEIDVNDQFHAAGRNADTVRGTTQEMIDEQYDSKAGKFAARVAYNVGMGVADNLVRMGLGYAAGGAAYASTISGAIMGSQVMSQAIVEGKQKGYSDEKAVGMALVQAAIEAATEKWSVEAVLKDSKNVFLQVGKAMLAEGSEEVASNAANYIADALANGDENELHKAYDRYRLQGMSDKDALKTVVWDVVGDNAEAFLVGGLSGAALGAGSSVAFDQRRKMYGDLMIQSGAVNDLLDDAEGREDKELQKYADKVKDKEKPSARAVGNLVLRLDELGEDKAAIVQKYTSGKRLSEADRKAVREDPEVQQMIEEQGAAPERRAVQEGDVGNQALMSYAEEYKDTGAEQSFKDNYRAGQNVDAYAAGYNAVWQAGVDGDRFEDVEAMFKGEWMEDFTREQAIEAHRAGYMEGMAAVSEPFAEIQVENNGADVIRSAELKNGVTLVNVQKRLDATMRTQLAVLQNFGKEKGIAFAVVDDYARRYANINGAQLGGTNKIIINLDAEGGLLLRTAGHEVFHYLEQVNADAAKKLREFVVDHYIREGNYESLAQEYAKQGYTGDIESELTADNLFDVMTQEGFLQKYAAQDANTVRTLRNTVAAFIRHINNALQKLTLSNPIHREIYDSLTKDKQFFEELRKMATEALDSLPSAQSAVKSDAKRSEGNQSNETVKYSKKADSSIKEQLKANQDMLNEMKPVDVINEHPNFKSGEDVQRWVLTKFNQIGFEVHRQGFGRVILDKKRVQNALRYFGTYEERIAFAAVPKVIKQGKVIDGHGDHKGRAYDTVTFAAPVILNGVRGNLAVVVRNERKSYYKVHRIVMPDGSQFSFKNEKRDIAERAGRNHEESVLSPADNISINSISPGQVESQENLSGKSETGKPDTKFSLKAPVEEKKELVAVHNFTTADLRNAAKLGGLAMPSIAILKSSQPHTRYGEISLVFRRSTIDPAADSRNAVYSGDAYTPTFPQTSFKISREVEERLSDLYYGYTRKNGENEFIRKLYSYTNDLERKVANAGGEQALKESLYDDTEMMNAYRVIHGEQPIEITSVITSRMDEGQIDFARAFLKDYPGDFAKDIPVAKNYGYIEMFSDAYNAFIAKNEASIRSALKAGYHAAGVSYDDVIDSFTNREIKRELNTVKKYLSSEDGTFKREKFDADATEKAIRKAVDQSAYKKWIDDLFSGAVEKVGIRNKRDPYTSAGVRRSWELLHDELTLENVVRNMAEEDDQGIGAFGRSIFGSSTRKYSSVEEIREDSGRLRQESEASFDQRRKEFSERFFDIAHKISSDGSVDAGDLLCEAITKYKTVDAIRRYVRKEVSGWGNYSDAIVDEFLALVQDIRSMPTEYFEAKPKRAVGFDEIAYAVIPASDTEAVSILDGLNVRYVTYEDGNDSARTKALNDQADKEGDIRFSIKAENNVSDSPQFKRWFGDSKVKNADGTPKVMYRGGAETINVFDRKKSRASNLYGRGFYFTEDKSAAARYGDVREYYLRIEHPLTPGKHTLKKEQFRRFLSAIENGYDEDWDLYNYGEDYSIDALADSFAKKGDFEALQDISATAVGDLVACIESFNEINGTEFDGIILPTETVVFDSRQIKSATDNIGTFDRNNPDIRFSLKPASSISEENRRLIEENETYKALIGKLNRQIAALQKKVVDPKGVRKLAKDVRAEYRSKIPQADLEEKLTVLFDYIANEWDIDFGEITRVAAEIAKDVIAQSDALNTELTEQYADLRDYLKTTKLQLTSLQKSEMAVQFDGYENFRRKNFSKIRFTKDGIKLDEVWGELCERWPEFFKIDEHEAEMPIRLMDAIEATNPFHENPYGMNMDEAAYDLALRIYDAYYDIPEVGSLQRQISDLRTEYKEKYKKALQKTRTEYEGKLAEQVARMERKGLPETRRRAVSQVLQSANALAKKLAANSAKKNVPDVIKVPVMEMLNTITAYSESGRVTELNKSFFENLRKAHERLTDLYKDGKEDALKNVYAEHLDLTEDFMEQLRQIRRDVDELLEVYGKDERHVLQMMDLTQLDVLNRVLVQMHHMVTKAGELYQNELYRNANDLSRDTIRDLSGMRERSAHKFKAGDTLETFLGWTNATPYYVFKRFGAAGLSIFNEMQTGWDNYAFRVRDVRDYALSAYTAKEVRAWEKVVHTFTDKDGKEFRLTTPQVMSIYCLSKRDAARRHLLGGGITPGQVGKYQQSQRYKLDEQTLDAIIAALSERQVEVADKLQSFLSTTCAEWGNAVSMKRFGIRIFTEKFYFPMAVDQNTVSLGDTPKMGSGLFDLINRSFTKELNDKASNALYAQNIFDVFTAHAIDMAQYNALALPVLDMMKWYNGTVSAEDQAGENEGTSKQNVRAELERVFGAQAKTYVDQFVRDINGTTSEDRSIGISLMRNFKIAKVAANLNVALVQPTAYVRAANVLDPKYLSSALSGMKNIRKHIADMQEYSGIGLWKSMGFFDVDVNKSLATMIKHGESTADKVREQAMKGAEVMDNVTWGVLFYACQKWAYKEKGLAFGSEACNKAAAEKFREVVYATQVVDSTMTRSALMRSKTTHDKLMSAFMSEPTLSYNMVMDQFYNVQKDVQSGMPTLQAMKKNAKPIARMVGVYCMTAIASALLEAVTGALRDEDDDEFGEKYKKALVDNLFSDLSLLQKIPIVKYFYEAAKAAVEKRSASYSNQTTQVLEEFTSTVNALRSGNVWEYRTIYKMLTFLSDATGLPASSLTREVVAVWNTVVGETHPEYKLRRYAEPTVKSKVLDVADEEDAREQIGKMLDEAVKARRKKYPDESQRESEKEAKSGLKTSITSAAHDIVKGGDTQRARQLMQESGLYEPDDIRKNLDKWSKE